MVKMSRLSAYLNCVYIIEFEAALFDKVIQYLFIF